MSTDRKDRSTDAKLADRRFDDPDVRAVLDDVSYAGMVAQYGVPHVDTQYTVAPGWTNGMGRPALADDDPAVMQAIGRCATHRVRWGKEVMPGGIHTGPCGWCEWPLEELLVACSWAVWQSGHISSETVTWRGSNETHYTRPGRHDVFTNPVHATFWDLPRREREHLVQAAIEASRA